jgi:predicted nucleotidyltransferase
MRLLPAEREIIRTLATRIFGDGTRVLLFGSRVDDSVKGGDIDLYVQSPDAEQALTKKREFVVALKLALGDQKIDVVISSNPSRFIEQEALKHGVAV